MRKTAAISNRTVRLACLALGSLMLPSAAANAQNLDYKTAWVGNTFSGAAYTTIGGFIANKHVQLNVSDMCVDADGTLFTNSFWDEGGAEAGIYKNGDQVGHCIGMSHGWGRMAGFAIAADNAYVYADMTQNGDDGGDGGVRKNSNGLPVFPARGTQWYCIRRFHKNGTSAPFPTGYGDWSDMMILNTCTVNNNRYPDANAKGLAVHNGLLYVSDPYRSRISVYDLKALTGTPLRSFPVPSPGKIVFDASSHLWVLQGSQSAKLLCYSEDGHPLQKQILFKPGMVPAALAYNSASRRIMVADQGPEQNIKLYDPEHLSGVPTRAESTFGHSGGIHSGINGKVGPLKFFDPAGVGADKAGNIYVANTISSGGGPGISLESYTPYGKQNWALKCLEFVTCDDADPKNETDVYSSFKRYSVEYTKSGTANWSFAGFTQDRFKYPDDPRRHADFSGGVWVRWIHGIKYLFVTQQMGHEICVLRFNPESDGEIGIPYAYITGRYQSPAKDGWPAGQPGTAAKSTEWIWCDTNGNGKIDPGEYSYPAANSADIYDAGWGLWVDKHGDIWQCGHGHIRHFKMQLNSKGRPVWDYQPGHVELLNPPALPNGAQWKHGVNADNDDMDRIEYQSDSDTMYISGFTTDYPDNTNGEWGSVGRVVYRYDHWNGERTIHAGYPIVLPWGEKGSLTTKSMTVAGDYLFAVEARDPEVVHAYNVNTGKEAGTMQPGAEVGKRSGWVDANYGLRAYVRQNGEYLIFAEEDLYEKAIIYRWTPPKQ